MVQDSLLRAQIVVLAVNLALLFHALDVLDLTRDPVLLHVGRLVIDLLNLLLDVVAHVLGRSDEFVTVTASLQVGTLSVEAIHLQSLLLDLEQSILDVLLNVHHIGLFLFKLTNQVVELLLENLILSRRVKVIKSNSGDFISVVLDFDLFL